MSDFLTGFLESLGMARALDNRMSANIEDVRDPTARKGFETAQDLSPVARSQELAAGLTHMLFLGPTKDEHAAGVALGFGDMFAQMQNEINKKYAQTRTRIPTQAGSSTEDWLNSTEGQIWQSSPGMKQTWDAYRRNKQARGAFKK